MNEITFAHPSMFYLLLLLVPLIGWYVWKQHAVLSSVRVSDTNSFRFAGKTLRYYFRHLPFVLRMLVLVLVVGILARPQSTNRWKDEETLGIDIVISLDISSSMLAEDFSPNRLEAAKDVAVEFINGRPADRMGLVLFSGESFTQCPVTTDHNVLINLFRDIKSGMLEDGTAIGMGLATAVSRLKESKAISKVVILLTDGENNKGEISPVTAAEIAQTFGIRVYTIGVGTKGKARYPFKGPFGTHYDYIDVNIDEGVLKEIANLTGGQYFRATNNEKLKEIYQEIDQLEKSKIDVKRFSKKEEEFFWLAVVAGSLLLLEIIIRNTWLKTIP